MKFRLARHTNSIEELANFYVKIIGLDLLDEFKNHSGYDGVFIGKNNLDWHLEFTQTIEKVNHTFDDDDLLVFYPGTQSEYDEIIVRINKNNITHSVPKNPYWQTNGITIQNPDGHYVIISKQRINEI
ncbi:hypothetical protein [Aurantibacillus circumpalustris]|uniref:hypothetical protein n=1 Tax=Aurantibacillus circumpalustris TaxID=3036359 RepID=UPI00295B6027|nr:hypothetical protein [Aurantibacillus circumpalustris]